MTPIISIFGTSPHGNDQQRHRGPVPWTVVDPAPVSVVIATIPPRVHQLNRALLSIKRQTLQPEHIVIQVDDQHEGAAITRNKALQQVPRSSEWVAFLDDDDYFGLDHIKECVAAAGRQSADYVYPWFIIAGPSIDPFPQFFKRPWDDNDPHQTTITTLVRRELAQVVGFRPVDEDAPPTKEGHRYGEDFQFTLECMGKGAKIYHLPLRTWYWVVTGHNTSGRPEGWQKAW